MNLADQTCVPCKGGVPPMDGARAQELLRELDAGWAVNADGHLERTYTVSNFVEAIAFANRVGDIAEEQNHHPDLHVAWGKCTVEIWTHKINGLTESDFILAAKFDDAMVEGPSE